jgi:hypothetical protein
MPTLFLPEPYWCEAEESPWSCIREDAPRTLATTALCETCPKWEPRQSRTIRSTQVPIALDWFYAFRAPHETD